MTVSYEKDFYIFQGKTFKNWKSLNDAGLMLFRILTDMFQDPEVQADFYNNVSDIIVTSQDRTKRNVNHSNGNAIDITVYPLGMNVWLFLKLREYRYTSFISSYNRHIHFDLRTEGLSGVECLYDGKGWPVMPKNYDQILTADNYSIKIDPPERMQTYLYKYYKIYNLPNLKLSIWSGLNSPFIGTKKLIQNTESKIEKIIDDTIKPAFNKVLIYAGLGLLAYMLIKNSGERVVYVGRR